jgi:hypothetical protein
MAFAGRGMRHSKFKFECFEADIFYSGTGFRPFAFDFPQPSENQNQTG